MFILLCGEPYGREFTGDFCNYLSMWVAKVFFVYYTADLPVTLNMAQESGSTLWGHPPLWKILHDMNSWQPQNLLNTLDSYESIPTI